MSENGETFGQRLRSARDASNLTQSALATAAGVQSITISRYERDTVQNPPMSIVSELARVLGVSSDWLYHGSEVAAESMGDLPPGLAEFLQSPFGGHVTSEEREFLTQVPFKGRPKPGDMDRRIRAYYLALQGFREDHG